MQPAICHSNQALCAFGKRHVYRLILGCLLSCLHVKLSHVWLCTDGTHSDTSSWHALPMIMLRTPAECNLAINTGALAIQHCGLKPMDPVVSVEYNKGHM